MSRLFETTRNQNLPYLIVVAILAAADSAWPQSKWTGGTNIVWADPPATTRVGIGTNAPSSSYLLHIAGNAAAGTRIGLQNTASGSPGTTWELVTGGGTGVTSGSFAVTQGSNNRLLITTAGAATLNGTLGVTGATTLSSTLGVTGATTLSGTVGITGVQTNASDLVFSAAAGIIRSNTLDGADTKRLVLGGGGATDPTRGGHLVLHGNEFTGANGDAQLIAGLGITGTPGSVRLKFGAGSADGLVVNGLGQVSIPGPLDLAGGMKVSGGAGSGSYGARGEIHSNAADGLVLVGRAGTTTSWVLARGSDGNTVMDNPAGSMNVRNFGSSVYMNNLSGVAARIGTADRMLAWRDGTVLRFGDNAGGWTDARYGIPSGTHGLDIAGTTRFTVSTSGVVLNGPSGVSPEIQIQANAVANVASLQGMESGGGGVLVFKTKTTGGVSTEALRITNTQTVGIGTSSPDVAYKLDVNGGAIFRGPVAFANSGLQFANGHLNLNGANNATDFRVNVNNGHVATNNGWGLRGYGEGSPGEPNTGFVALRHNGVDDARIEVDKTNSGSYRGFRIYTSGLERYRVDAAGNHTLGGPLKISTSAAISPQLEFVGASGTNPGIFISRGTSTRWGLISEFGTEAGLNSGSDFSIRAYQDGGTSYDVPLTISRAPGGPISISRPMNLGSLTVTRPGQAVNTLSIGSSIDVDASEAHLDFRREYNATEKVGARISTEAKSASVATSRGVDLTFSTQNLNGTGLTEKLRITQEGRVGIGVSIPQAALDVSGSTGYELLGAFSYGSKKMFEFQAADFGAGAYLAMYDNAGSRVNKIDTRSGQSTWFNSGKVGIGTTTPEAALHVTRTGQAVNTLAIGSASDIDNSEAHLDFRREFNSSQKVGARIHTVARSAGTATARGTDLAFSTLTESGGSLTEKMRITQEGGIGIGIDRPDALLHVAGTSRFEGATFLTSLAGSGNRLLTANAAGQVGIATTIQGNYEISGDLAVEKRLAFSGYGAGTTASIWRDQENGLNFRGVSGGTNQMLFLDKDGAPLLSWPTSQGKAIFHSSTQFDGAVKVTAGAGSGQPLIKFSGTYNGGEGATFWQDIEGTLRINLNNDANTGFTIGANGNVGVGTQPDVNARLNVDGTGIVGVTKIATVYDGPMNAASISHYNHGGTTGFAFGQWANGVTQVNAPAGKRVNLSVGGTVKGIVEDTAIQSFVNFHVAGNLSADRVLATEWAVEEVPDFVFEKNYKLASLEKVESFVKKNKHLPEVPSAKNMKKQGLDLVKMNFDLLKKVEELTLYAIEQNKVTKAEQKRSRDLEREVQDLKQALQTLAKSRD